jgi:hypothetical protein
MKKLVDEIRNRPLLAFFLKYFGLFFILFTTLGLAALFKIVSVESNPFFYANF